jgi:hypothetical protein
MFMLYLLLLPELIPGTALARLHARTAYHVWGISPTSYATSRLEGKKKHERKKPFLRSTLVFQRLWGKVNRPYTHTRFLQSRILLL